MLPRLMCLVSSADDLSVLPSLVDAGVDCFQVRDKVASSRELVALTRAVMTAGVPVVVDDRVDVALAAGAAGVHVGASDLSVPDVRRLAPRLLVGATCRDAEEVRAAARDGADYAGVGPVFATSSKSGLPTPIGVGGVVAAVDAGLPVVGIGGIDAANAGAVLAAGAAGVAVIGGIWRAASPVGAARALAAAVAP